MVVRANKKADGIGGHLSSFASSASLYDVGFNHFWQGKDDGLPGDHIYMQGHAAPGIYARAYLEGRLSEENLDNFRMEIGGNGLSSYPHPRLMPDFWEFPTVSMGLGPINSIYHARFARYLTQRRIDDASQGKVWAFLGDGETDEPETLGAISLAGRSGLGNLIWVINCNLQRLDGPVRGNGPRSCRSSKRNFRGAGLEHDQSRAHRSRNGTTSSPATSTGSCVRQAWKTTLDGDWQRYATEGGAVHPGGVLRDRPAPAPGGRPPERRRASATCLRMGGHDYRKLYSRLQGSRPKQPDRGTDGDPGEAPMKGWTLGRGLRGPQRRPTR